MRWNANFALVRNSMVPASMSKTRAKTVILKNESSGLKCANVIPTSRIYQNVSTYFSNIHTHCKYTNYIQAQYSNTPNNIFLHIQLIHIHPDIANYTPHMSNYVKYVQTYFNIDSIMFKCIRSLRTYIQTYPNMCSGTSKCFKYVPMYSNAHNHFKYMSKCSQMYLNHSHICPRNPNCQIHPNIPK